MSKKVVSNSKWIRSMSKKACQREYVIEDRGKTVLIFLTEAMDFCVVVQIKV